MKNQNLMAYAADTAGLVLRAIAPTSVRPLGGAVSTDKFGAGTAPHIWKT